MPDDKISFRKQALARRDSLDKNEVMKNSSAIIEKLKNTEFFKASDTVMSYINFKNEVITFDFISHCLDIGKTVAVPAVINLNGKKKIEAVKINNIFSDLKLSNFGIPEPVKLDEIIDINKIDLAIVPGVAFDIEMNRLGFGAGYYDKFFGNCCSANLIKIGLSYEMQLYENIPADRHDVRMDYIITEKRIL